MPKATPTSQLTTRGAAKAQREAAAASVPQTRSKATKSAPTSTPEPAHKGARKCVACTNATGTFVEFHHISKCPSANATAPAPTLVPETASKSARKCIACTTVTGAPVEFHHYTKCPNKKNRAQLQGEIVSRHEQLAADVENQIAEIMKHRKATASSFSSTEAMTQPSTPVKFVFGSVPAELASPGAAATGPVNTAIFGAPPAAPTAQPTFAPASGPLVFGTVVPRTPSTGAPAVAGGIFAAIPAPCPPSTPPSTAPTASSTALPSTPPSTAPTEPPTAPPQTAPAASSTAAPSTPPTALPLPSLPAGSAAWPMFAGVPYGNVGLAQCAIAQEKADDPLDLMNIDIDLANGTPPPSASPAPTTGAKTTASKKPKAYIPNVWKCMPEGDWQPIHLTRNRQRPLKLPIDKMGNQTNAKFQAICQKAEWMSDKIDSWIICAALPMHGLGEMRIWENEDLLQDAPDVKNTVRSVLFDALENLRIQRLDEVKKESKANKAKVLEAEAAIRESKDDKRKYRARAKKFENESKRLRAKLAAKDAKKAAAKKKSVMKKVPRMKVIERDI